MSATRTRRIVKRAVMAVAVIVAMSGWYIGVWIIASRAERDGFITYATAQQIRPAFVPLIRFCESGLLGADQLSRLYWRINPYVVVRREVMPGIIDIETRCSTMAPTVPAVR